MPEYCYITNRPAGLVIECSYDEDFIALLKHHIPAQDRTWISDLKEWRVTARYATLAASLARSHFDNAIDC